MSTSGSTSVRSNAARPAPVVVRYAPHGVARDVLTCRDPEIVLSGPAGTGKSRACLEKLHLVASRYPGCRLLLARKTRASLTQTAMVTFERRVLHPLDGVRFHTGAQEYRYPNGSVIVVGGLDNPIKVMSAEYDLVYPQEATELTEHDWESLTTRLRNGVLPYQQLIADCNPAAPSHWLKRRADRGATRMLESRHEDNPTLWDRAAGAWTDPGRAYIAKLDALTGVRLLRLRRGLWAAAEGLVYDGWDPAVHLISSVVPLPEDPVERAAASVRLNLDPAGVPRSWPRYLGVDFGFTNPFVCGWWAEDPDGRLYRYREIYRTTRLVEDHAADIKRLSAGEPAPRAVICDHDAEDRATLERHLGWGTTAAHKAVSPGIQAVAARLRPAGDGRPRLYLLRDALVERDPELDVQRKPSCTEQELEGYIWDTGGGRRTGEQPLKRDDHGLDALRYVVAQRDLVGAVGYGPNLWD